MCQSEQNVKKHSTFHFVRKSFPFGLMHFNFKFSQYLIDQRPHSIQDKKYPT